MTKVWSSESSDIVVWHMGSIPLDYKPYQDWTKNKPSNKTAEKAPDKAESEASLKEQELQASKDKIAILMEKIQADWLFQQWELFLSKNKIKAAIEAFSNLIAKYPYSDKVPVSHIKLWELYIKNEDYGKAEQILRTFLEDNKNSPEHLKVFFILAESLFSQYKYDISGTKPKMIEAKSLYGVLWETNFSQDIKNKSIKRKEECELQLAENDFLVVRVYKKTEKYRASLKRLSLMKVDYAWNEKILKRIEEMTPELEELYRKQTAHLKERQLSQLERRLWKYRAKKANLEKNLSDFEAEWIGLKWKTKEKYEKKLIELKKQIVNFDKEIIADETRIAEVNKYWYNPDMEPGMPDPNVVSWVIPWVDIEVIF